MNGANPLTDIGDSSGRWTLMLYFGKSIESGISLNNGFRGVADSNASMAAFLVGYSNTHDSTETPAWKKALMKE